MNELFYPSSLTPHLHSQMDISFPSISASFLDNSNPKTLTSLVNELEKALNSYKQCIA